VFDNAITFLCCFDYVSRQVKLIENIAVKSQETRVKSQENREAVLCCEL
jgi:hypothetical protein